jgi:hypothetical protein
MTKTQPPRATTPPLGRSVALVTPQLALVLDSRLRGSVQQSVGGHGPLFQLSGAETVDGRSDARALPSIPREKKFHMKRSRFLVLSSLSCVLVLPGFPVASAAGEVPATISVVTDSDRSGQTDEKDAAGQGVAPATAQRAFLIPNVDDDDGDNRIDATDDAVNGPRRRDRSRPDQAVARRVGPSLGSDQSLSEQG